MGCCEIQEAGVDGSLALSKGGCSYMLMLFKRVFNSAGFIMNLQESVFISR